MNLTVLSVRPFVIHMKNSEDYGYDPFDSFTAGAIEKLSTWLSDSFRIHNNLCPAILMAYLSQVEYLNCLI